VPSTFVDPSDLSVTLELNGDVMQDATTAELVFDVRTLVAAASQTLPLLPGDLLLTGSPAGNGQHWKRFLRDGDVMTGSIAGLGTQVVRCIAEGPAA
jgi:2-keto-4-pentenoate hydratase/2-oxohepta-3-ene-1,7-dioic acid hydratase in catechol pathway